MQDTTDQLAIWKSIERTHCAFRAKDQSGQGMTCVHLFNVEPRCAGDLCPIVNSNYLTFQREETTLFMVEKKTKFSRAPAQAWREEELQGTKGQLQDKIKKRIQELNLAPNLSNKARRKFERLYDLVTEIKSGLEQAEIPEISDEADESKKAT